jgi:multidrug efflux pump subunit AcrB
VGRDFFPKVDAGQIRLHVTAPAGTRLEETERIFSRVEEAIARIIPIRIARRSSTTSGFRTGSTSASPTRRT